MTEEASHANTTQGIGRGRASAVPARLAGWRGWTEAQNQALRQAALRLDAAIEALNQSGSSPELLGRLDPVGAGVSRYVASNASTDAWVGAIGAALLDLARSRLPAEVARDAGNTRLLAGGLVTTTDSRIAARVEPRAEDLDRRLTAAGRLADRAAAALDAGDRPALAGVLGEIQPLDQDPEAAAAFFAQLGPEPALTWAALGDVATTLGPVLAAATRSESWDPAFDGALFAGRAPASLALLAAGVFAEDFLAAAGDTWLLLGRDDDAAARDHEVTAVLDALSRDPDAALAFLVESSQGDADAALPQSRLTEILLRYGSRLERPGPVAAALAGVLTSAGRAPSAGEPYGGPFDQQTHAGVLLFDLAAMPGGMVPESLLPAVASILAGNLDALLRVPLTGWQERAVRLAVLDQAGRPNPQRWALIDAGFAGWRAAAAPAEYLPRTPGNRAAWDRYLEWTGTLAGLLARATGAPFELVLGDRLTAELEAVGAEPAPEVTRARRAFSEATGA